MYCVTIDSVCPSKTQELNSRELLFVNANKNVITFVIEWLTTQRSQQPMSFLQIQYTFQQSHSLYTLTVFSFCFATGLDCVKAQSWERTRGSFCRTCLDEFRWKDLEWPWLGFINLASFSEITKTTYNLNVTINEMQRIQRSFFIRYGLKNHQSSWRLRHVEWKWSFEGFLISEQTWFCEHQV